MFCSLTLGIPSLKCFYNLTPHNNSLRFSKIDLSIQVGGNNWKSSSSDVVIKTLVTKTPRSRVIITQQTNRDLFET